MCSELELFKQCVSLLVFTKTHMAPHAEYALCVLLEGAVLLSDFTLDTNELLKQVNSLEGTECFKSLDMSSVFNLLLERKNAPIVIKSTPQTPPGQPQGSASAQKPLLRGILLYSRAHIVPSFGEDMAAFNTLSTDPDFIMDTIFVHPPPSAPSKAQNVFDFLIDLDKSANHDRAYCFESTANPRRCF